LGDQSRIAVVGAACVILDDDHRVVLVRHSYGRLVVWWPCPARPAGILSSRIELTTDIPALSVAANAT